MPTYSYMPIDVGFDIRVNDMWIELPNEPRMRVKFCEYNREGVDVEKSFEGTREEVRLRLMQAGYGVKPD
jgi:hypothetical protein